MKFSVTVQDLSAEQAVDLIDKLSEGSVAPAATAAAYAAPPSLQPATSVAAPVSAPPAAPVDANVDANGLPWDERIHAGSKTKNKDGSWKRKKGVQDVDFDAVVEELKGETGKIPYFAKSQQQDSTAPAPATPVAAPVSAPTAPVAPPPPVAMPTAPAPATPVAAPVSAPTATRDFNGLMQQMSIFFANKQIDPTYPNGIVDRINQGFGASLATLTDIANDPRMIEYAWQCIEVDTNAGVIKAAA